MSVVKINAIEVPEGMGVELEKRFSAHKNSANAAPGFEGMQLLRPVAGETRYFAVSTWASEEAYRAWRHGEGYVKSGHGKPSKVSTGSALLEFEVVEL